MILQYIKESVELTFVYLIEGCGKTLIAINDTIPHTRIDMGYGYAEATRRKYLYEVSVAPYRPAIMKTTTFSIKDLRKNTFTICNAKRPKRVTLQM